MNIPLTKIRGFLAVAEFGSFRRAAEELALTQSALSVQIRQLEEIFGVSLFSRTTRSVRLTPAGESLRITAQRAFAELQAAVAGLRDQAALRYGRVVVACVPTIASSILPKAVVAFHERHPGIMVRILDEVAQISEQLVLDGEADFGIGPRPARRKDLAFMLLRRDHFVAVFPRAHPFAGRKTVTLADVMKYPLLAMRQGSNVRDLLEQAFVRQGRKLGPSFEFVNHYTIGAMVEAGLGISVLPSSALSMMSHPQLLSARVVKPQIIRELGIVQRKGESFSPAAHAFLNVLRDIMEVQATR